MPTIGITQSGSSGSYSYSVTGSYSQAANCPIFDVSWGDAARFCNWLQNGQPTSGVENASTTENGAYTLNGAITNAALDGDNPQRRGHLLHSVGKRMVQGGVLRPERKPGGAGYWTYPTKSNTAPSNILSATGTNNANLLHTAAYTDPTNLPDAGRGVCGIAGAVRHV